MNKYIFLDFNGTVLDDVDLCLNLLNEMLYEKENKTVDLIEYKQIFDFPIIKYYIAAGFDFSKYTFEELANYFIVEYTKRNLTESKIFDDLEEFVHNIKNLGYKVVICSASKKVLLLEQLKEFKIIDLFDDVIGLDIHYAASKLELAKEYVKNIDIDLENSYFIGDTTHDAEVGVECGLNFLLIDRGHQSEDVLSKTKKPILHSFFEVVEFIRNKNSCK